MPRFVAPAAVLLLGVLPACGERVSQLPKPSASPTSTAPADAAAPAAAPRGPLLVTIVVDQLAAWIAAERWPLLPEDGGFKRLLREGTYVRALRYAHAVTDTAPGHAALYTGAVPRESGIFGNEVVDEKGDVNSILRDATTKIVSPEGEGGVGSSAARLRVDTVADRFRASNPRARVLSLSLKDRGAILPGGKKPDAAVWLDVKLARFVTSTAFATSLPSWVEPHGNRASVARALASPWERSWRGVVSAPDDQAGEGDESGLGRAFPHVLDRGKAPGRVFRTTPASDATLLAIALDALDEPATFSAPTLLALSLSANDYVGHVFGPDSVEAWDELARLDRSLATFFGELDRRFGPGGWSAMLSADHGTITMPEAAKVPGVRHWCARDAGAPDPWERPCGDAYRIDLEDLTRDLVQAASRAFPKKTDLVRGIADPYVFLGDGARALSPADRGKLDATLRGVLKKTPGVRRVLDVNELGACPAIENDDALAEEDRIAALVCRSANSEGEHTRALYVVLQPGSFFDPRIVRGFGASHGSPYLYDRTVPLVVRAPGRARANTVKAEPVDFRAFARTAASLLGVSPPPAATPGRDLGAE